jgi:ATP-dependent protease ClpP protease subunit
VELIVADAGGDGGQRTLVVERHPRARSTMSRGYFMTSEQASQYGIIDQVIPNRIETGSRGR